MASPTADQIRVLYRRICQCAGPEDIFGAIDTDGQDKKRALAALRAVYLELIEKHHPDKYQRAPQLTRYMIDEIASALNSLHQLARTRIEQGIYGQPEQDEGGEPVFDIETRKHTYHVVEHLVEGDTANIHHAYVDRDDGGRDNVCIKVALSPEENDLIRNEIRVLDLVQHKSLPVYLDAFKTTDGEMAWVMRYIDGFDLMTVRDMRPQGLDQEHVCWILERLLSVLGFMHANRVIHGNIEPGNIMIRPRDHNAFLIDFVFSIIDPGRTGAGFKGYTEGYSAPEVFAKKSPIPPSDMYSLGKCMVYLLGGDIESDRFPRGVDRRIRQFLQQFLLPNPMHRARDAWELWHKLRRLRQQVFPGRRFVPLTLD